MPDNSVQSGPRRSAFYDFCLFFLSTEWILFGSLHFSFHEMTVREIPKFIPFKDFIATTTGMLEVAAGMLVLVADIKVRKLAAMLSLFLVFLLLPAMYNIVSESSATDGMGVLAAPFRAVLMPNNILLTICSAYVLRQDAIQPIGEARSQTSQILAPIAAGPMSAQTIDRSVLIVGLVLLASNCAGFLTIRASNVSHPTAYLWAMMCLATGAIIGFLFGVPKLNTSYKDGSRLQTNSNIDAISDWLTKIIIGVGLINIRQVGDFIDVQSKLLATHLALVEATSADQSFAEALILFFFAAGLIEGYLLTRMYLGPEFGER